MSRINRLLSSLRKNKLEDQLNDELQFHIEMRTQEFTAAGMTPEEARRQASLLFGNSLLQKERTRDMDTIGWIETLLQDLRYACRMLRWNPGFTVVAILTLALGIGATTTIFSLMNAYVFRPLRVEDPDRLVMICEAKRNQAGERHPTLASYIAWKKYSRTFQDVALGSFDGDPTTLAGIGHAERISGGECGLNFLSMLDVKPLRGRLFLAEDASNGQSTTVVISERLWRRTFSADPNILGQAVVMEGEKKTIVGVLPSDFSVLPWDMNVDAWIGFSPGGPSEIRWLDVIGRLRPGVTVQQAQAELNSIAKGLEPRRPEVDGDWSVRVESLHEWLVGGSRRYFYLLLGAVGFVLLIACANVANLLLARDTVRQKEIAIRASLGAGRWRLIRQLLAETVLLGLLGGAVGLLVGFVGTRTLVSIAPIDRIHSLPVTIDLRVLGFTLCLSLLTGILFGLMPAFRTSKSDLYDSLKEGGQQSSGASRPRGQSLLLVSEIALALVLLVGAGLMVNSFLRRQNVELGFNPKNVLRADVFLDGPKFWHNSPGVPGAMKTVTPQGDAFFREVLERIHAIPGVVSVGISHLAPPSRDVQPVTFTIIGRPVPPSRRQPQVRYNEVSAGYFRSLEIPLVKGRNLTERDTERSPWVVVINETMARRYFPNEDPIGKLVMTTMHGGGVNVQVEDRLREIVGVVGDVRHMGFGSNTFPIMYGSYLQHGPDYPAGTYTYHLWKSITVRTAGDPMNLVVSLQKVVADVDKDQALFGTQSMESGLADSVAFPRFHMHLFGIFGGLGLVLAAVGIYGVTSYLVAQRTHEIGVQMALGARRGDVLRVVIGRGLGATIIGLSVGIAASLALTRLISGFLFGVKATDPLTYSVVALVLATVAMVACYLPARRATKVDPMVALRHE